jgi:mRNA interferase MazF
MTILPGEFWIAEIPFTGGVGSKKRPVLVLWLDCLERSLLLGRVGQIGPSDAALVKAVWDSRVKPQF